MTETSRDCALLQADVSAFWFRTSLGAGEGDVERETEFQKRVVRKTHGNLGDSSMLPQPLPPLDPTVSPCLDRYLWKETRSERRIRDPGISDIGDAGRGGSSIKFQAGLFCKFCLSWTQERKAYSLSDTGC